MGPEGAVGIIFRDEIAAAADPAAARARYVAEYREKFANPFTAAALGYLDEVIRPRETRPRLCRALALLANKRQERPLRKHGNIPLVTCARWRLCARRAGLRGCWRRGCATQRPPVSKIVGGRVIVTRADRSQRLRTRGPGAAVRGGGALRGRHRSSCERALNFDRDAPEMHARIAEVYLQLDRMDDAARAVKDSLALGETVDGLVADAHVRARRGDHAGRGGLAAPGGRRDRAGAAPTRRRRQAVDAYLELADAQLAGAGHRRGARHAAGAGRRRCPDPTVARMRLAAVAWALGATGRGRAAGCARRWRSSPTTSSAADAGLAVHRRGPHRRGPRPLRRGAGAIGGGAGRGRGLRPLPDGRGQAEGGGRAGRRSRPPRHRRRRGPAGADRARARRPPHRSGAGPGAHPARRRIRPPRTPGPGWTSSSPTSWPKAIPPQAVQRCCACPAPPPPSPRRGCARPSCCARQGKLAEAGQALAEAEAGVAPARRCPTRSRWRGRCWTSAGATSPRALARLDQALQKRAGSRAAAHGPGHAAGAAGRWQEALAVAEPVIADEPGSAEALNFWGFVAADHEPRSAPGAPAHPGGAVVRSGLGRDPRQPGLGAPARRRRPGGGRSSWSRRSGWSPKIRRSCPTWPSCTARKGLARSGARAAAQGAGRSGRQARARPAQAAGGAAAQPRRRQRREAARRHRRGT